MEKLGKEWQRRIIDVCGIAPFDPQTPTEIYLTHLHKDHMPLVHQLGKHVKFMVAEELVNEVEKRYGVVGRVQPCDDVLKLEHMYRVGMRIRGTHTYAYFIGNAMIIPECTTPRTILTEYKPKVALVFSFHQAHTDTLEPFSNTDPNIDYLLDNKTWHPYRENVIPKVLYSSTLEDRQLYMQKHHLSIRKEGKG